MMPPGIPRQYEVLYKLERVWLEQPELELRQLLRRLGGGRLPSDAKLIEKLRARAPEERT